MWLLVGLKGDGGGLDFDILDEVMNYGEVNAEICKGMYEHPQ